MEHETVFAAIRAEAKAVFGDRLVSLLVYGSAATEDFHAPTSDVNVLVVLKTIDLPALEKARELRRRLKKHRLAAPLLLTEAYIKASADVFPIEFLEIQEKHTLLEGKDVFSRLRLDLKNLRHECEHELKGRLIRLRQSFIEGGDKPEALKGLLAAAHNSNFPALRTALRLKKKKPPLSKQDVLEMGAKVFSLDASVLLQVHGLRHGSKWSAKELVALFEKYSAEVEKLANAVDRM